MLGIATPLLAQSKVANYKGLEITVAAIERAKNVALFDCPPGTNTVRGNAREGEEFAVVKLAFKVTPAFNETTAKKLSERTPPGVLPAWPVLIDASAKTYRTSGSFIDPGSKPEYECSFPFRVPMGTKLGKIQIDTTTIDLSAFDKN